MPRECSQAAVQGGGSQAGPCCLPELGSCRWESRATHTHTPRVVPGATELEKEKRQAWVVKYTNSLSKGLWLLGVFCFSFLLEKTETVVWNEINFVERYGMAYEKFAFPGIQKTLSSVF